MYTNANYPYITNQFVKDSSLCSLSISIVGTVADGLINGPPAATIASVLTDPNMIINFPILTQRDYLYKFRIEGKAINTGLFGLAYSDDIRVQIVNCEYSSPTIPTIPVASASGYFEMGPGDNPYVISTQFFDSLCVLTDL